jgi:hypothetical protein
MNTPAFYDLNAGVFRFNSNARCAAHFSARQSRHQNVVSKKEADEKRRKSHAAMVSPPPPLSGPVRK